MERQTHAAEWQMSVYKFEWGSEEEGDRDADK